MLNRFTLARPPQIPNPKPPHLLLRAHHIIDPSSGRPTESSVSVAAVAASSAAAAEVFATAAIVAGWPDAADVIESVGLSGFVITTDDQRHDLGSLAQNPPETAVRADGRRRE